MSEIKTNKLTGTSTAGSILVTGEGNSTTTNLQQGLAKMYCRFDTDSSTSITGSANVASLTDAAVGQTSINLTNAFDAVTYTILLGNDEGEEVAFHRTGNGNTASKIGVANYAQDSNAYADADIMSAASQGDLA